MAVKVKPKLYWYAEGPHAEVLMMEPAPHEEDVLNCALELERAFSLEDIDRCTNQLLKAVERLTEARLGKT